MRFKDVLAAMAILIVAQCSWISTRAEEEATLAKAQGQPKAPKKEAKKAERPKVTIRGTVKDENGKPVNDATVFLFAKDLDRAKKGDELHKCHQIAKTVTFGNGEYEFKEVEHPLFLPEIPPPFLDVVVLAKDQRFAWRGPLHVAVAGDKRVRLKPSLIVPGTPAEVNLEFRPTKPIAGVVVDEEGKPVAGAVIRLSDCRRNDRVDRGELPANEWLNYPLGGETAAAPDAIAKRTSDADGKFAFAEIPVDMRAMFFVTHDDFSTVGFGATNAEDEQAGVIEGGLKFQRGHVKIRLRKTYSVPIEVKVGDSDKPAVGAMVVGIEIAEAGDQSTALNAGETDKNGRVTLKLPTGKFKLRPGFSGLPADYPTTDIVVDRANREQPIILRVNN